MKKLTLLVLLLPFFTVFAQDFDMKANFSNSVGYNITEKGYIALPKQTAKGIIATNNRYSEIYLVKDKSLKTLVATRGCGSFTNLNKEKTLLGFKSIDENGNQAPAILNLMTEEVMLLEDYSNQCGQVSFSNDGTIAYTVGNNLIINRNGVKKSYDLGYYTNIANLSPDGKSIAFSDPDGHPILMDLTTGSKTKMSDIGDLYNPKWSPDGQKIVVEQGNATLYVIEPAQKKVLKLDKGFEASWTADSKDLVYSRSDYENDDVFFFKGISVHQASFDGKMRRVIIPTSKECPQEVALLDNGKLAVSYSYGNRRLVAVSLSDTKSSIEEELFTLPAQNVHFGKVPKNLKNNNVTLRPSTKSTPQTKVGSIGKDDIPYINQVYDVPASYAGCTGYGYVACAPSTSCMLLGYYKLVPPKAVSSRHGGWGSTIYYSWYVGQQYTSSTNYTFSLAAIGNNCYAKGGYGYMWNGGSPSSKMRGFYQNNGVTSAAYDYSGYSKIKSECAANYPYSWCITSSRSNGHLILPFRADARCVKVNNVWTILDDRTGSVVVHDPYGDANASTWLGDGRYSTYDCPGYNNGYIRMSNAWGVVVRYTKPTTTSIKTSVSSLAYGGVTVGSTSQKTFKVTLEGLSSATVTSSNNSIFAVSPTSVSNGTTVTVTFKPTAAQSYSGTITVANGSHKATVSCSGSGINPPLTFTQVWNYSERSTAGTPAWASDKTKIRNMDFGGGKLYVVNPVDGVIHVINSQTGAKLKDLDMTGVEGGALKIIDCKYVGGKIIACNIVASGSPLKVYVWDNDNAQPRVFLNTTSYGGMDRIGDCLSIEGDLTNGKIYFAAGGTTTANKVLMYTITNGVCSTTPTITELNEAGDKIVLGLSPRVRPSGTGKYWVMGQNYYPTLCSGEGTAIIPLNPDALLNDCAGNDFKAFTFKGTQYGIATTYQPGATAQEKLTLGRMCLVDATSGWADADKIGEYPSGGMGTTRNTSFSTSVAVAVNGTSGVEMWVLIHNQGIAYFKHGTVPTYSFDPPAPTITLSPSGSQSFTAQINTTQQKTITVGGSNLTANVSLALSGTNANMFSLSATSVDKAGGSVVVTYKPTAVGSHTATLTATSTGATNVTLTLNGTATGAGPTVPTLTKVWETANVLAAADARYGTGYNGKVYATDATNKILYSWDSNGCQKTSVATEIGGGFACTCDDNGNILTNTGKWGTSFTDWQIYSIANKSTQTLAVSVPSGVTAGYIYANIAATGNVLSSAGGILYMTPAGKTVAAKIVVKNGAQDASSSSGPTYSEGTFSNEDAVAPLNVDNLTAETFMWRQRNGNINYISGSTLKTYSQPSNKTTNTGFDAFKLKGVEYGVVPTGTYCADGFSVFTLSDGEVVASRTETKTTTGAYYVSIKVEEVSDTKVNIYYYKAGDMAAMYTFEVPGGTVDVPIIESNQMIIYNNREMLFVDGVEAAQIDLYTLTGQKIRVVENQNEMSVAGLQGIYLVVVKDNSGLTRTGKIIVK